MMGERRKRTSSPSTRLAPSRGLAPAPRLLALLYPALLSPRSTSCRSIPYDKVAANTPL